MRSIHRSRLSRCVAQLPLRCCAGGGQDYERHYQHHGGTTRQGCRTAPVPGAQGSSPQRARRVESSIRNRSERRSSGVHSYSDWFPGGYRTLIDPEGISNTEGVRRLRCAGPDEKVMTDMNALRWALVVQDSAPLVELEPLIQARRRVGTVLLCGTLKEALEVAD